MGPPKSTPFFVRLFQKRGKRRPYKHMMELTNPFSKEILDLPSHVMNKISKRFSSPEHGFIESLQQLYNTVIPSSTQPETGKASPMSPRPGSPATMSIEDLYYSKGEARQKAITRAEHQLHRPADLQMLPTLIESIKEQNRLIYAQLSAISSSQIEEAKVAKGLLEKSYDTIGTVARCTFQEIQNLSMDTHNLIYEYEMVRDVNNALSNVKQVRDMLATLMQFKEEVSDIRRVLNREMRAALRRRREAQRRYDNGDNTVLNNIEDHTVSDDESDDVDLRTDYSCSSHDSTLQYDGDDDENGDEDYSDEDDEDELLETHERISQLESFRNQALEESSTDPDLMQPFKDYLLVIDNLTSLFSGIIIENLQNLVYLAEEYPAKLVQIVRIIERQERIESIRQMREKKKNQPVSECTWKHYKAKCFECLSYFVQHQFRGIMDCDRADNIAQQGRSIQDTLDALMRLISNDLDRIQQHVEPCFPEQYHVMEFFISKYEEHARQCIRAMMRSPDTVAEEFIAIARWIKDFQTLISEEYDVSPMQFSEELDYIKGEFQRRTSITFTEWSSNIVDQDFAELTNEANGKSMQIASDGRVYTHAPVNFFSFIIQNLESISAAGLEDLVLQVSYTIRSSLMFFKDNMLHQAQRTFRNQDHLGQLCAIINNCSKCVEFITTYFETQLAKCLTAKSFKKLELEEVRHGFREAARTLTKQVLEIIIDTVDETFARIFSKDWYDSELLRTILLTFEDFTQETGILLEPTFSATLPRELANYTLTRYLDDFITKRFILERGGAELLEEDCKLLRSFFKGSGVSFKPLESVIQITKVEDIEDLFLVLSQVELVTMVITM